MCLKTGESHRNRGLCVIAGLQIDPGPPARIFFAFLENFVDRFAWNGDAPLSQKVVFVSRYRFTGPPPAFTVEVEEWIAQLLSGEGGFFESNSR
jgi:hypothetical protein